MINQTLVDLSTDAIHQPVDLGLAQGPVVERGDRLVEVGEGRG